MRCFCSGEVRCIHTKKNSGLNSQSFFSFLGAILGSTFATLRVDGVRLGWVRLS